MNIVQDTNTERIQAKQVQTKAVTLLIMDTRMQNFRVFCKAFQMVEAQKLKADLPNPVKTPETCRDQWTEFDVIQKTKLTY